MNIVKRISGAVYALFITILFSCSGSSNNPTPKSPGNTAPDSIKISADLTKVKQEMIGFGGALTWYSNWVTSNAKKNEIADWMFTDCGIDIIRFKNWYYPDNYPTDKTTTSMKADGSNAAWDATNELYTLAIQRNPNIKILLSSWGPPVSLKSNAALPQGTLKKDNTGAFMYDDFAQYWSDVLDHVPFNLDYISIQNEPTFTNSGWTTCEWANVETPTLPDYNKAFNKVYDKIKTRTKAPVMVGPESQDVSTFVSFANDLAINPNCGMYAFHPYNINSSGTASGITSSLQSVGSFSTKPVLMTEFSDNLDWYNTALFIQSALVNANISGYIYWKLAWSTPTSGTDAGMISVASANSTDYTVTPFYYLIKHFSKNIDSGYHRVETSSSNSSLITTAFISPDNSKMTVVVVNDGSTQAKVYFDAAGKTISSMSANQSVSKNTYYLPVSITSPAKSIILPAKSITTVVLGI